MILKTRIFLAFIIGLTLVGTVLWWNLKYPKSDDATKVSLQLDGQTRTFIGVADADQDGIPD